MNLKVVGIFLLIFSLAFSCKKSDSDAPSFDLKKNLVLKVGESKDLNASMGVSQGDAEKLSWTSSDKAVVSISDKGIMDAHKMGNAIIKYTYGDESGSSSVKVIKGNKALNLKPLGQSLSDDIIYSKNVLLKAPYRVMQCFDVDVETNTIFYVQIGRWSGGEKGQTRAHELKIIRGKPNQPFMDYMTLKYFGHGTNLAVEKRDDGYYIWIGSNGTKSTSTKEYGQNISVSCVKYVPGKVYEKGYGGETYFMNKGKHAQHPAIDKKNNLLSIKTSRDGRLYFYTYDLKDAENLPLTDFSFSVRLGGEENGTTEHIEDRTVKGHDLSTLKPIGAFSISNRMLGGYPFQGFDIDGDYVYVYDGSGNGSDASNGPSHANVMIFKIDGSIVQTSTPVTAISSISNLTQFGISNTGYMEAEGLKVKGNDLYIAFAARGMPGRQFDYRRATIFKYDGEPQ